MYSAKVQERVAHPRHVGPLEKATHYGVAGTPGDGPYVVLWLQTEDNIIRNAAYQTYGCPGAIASASMTAELAIGRSVEEALALHSADILQALDGLPEGKEFTAGLAHIALMNALQGDRNGRTDSDAGV